MRWPELALALVALASLPAAAQAPAAPPATVTLEQVLGLVSAGPLIDAARGETDAARAERAAAGAFLNPSLTYGRTRPSGGERTMFDGDRQDQASLELPVPIFGQRGARMRAADRGVERAESQQRFTLIDTRRQAAVEFVRLLQAQDQASARQRTAAEVERIRTLVAGGPAWEVTHFPQRR